MFCGNWKHIMEAKPEEFSYIGHLLGRLDLVHNKKGGLLGAPQQPRKFLITRCNPATSIYDEQDDRCAFDSDFRLLKNADRDLRFLARNDAAGIDNFERSP